MVNLLSCGMLSQLGCDCTDCCTASSTPPTPAPSLPSLPLQTIDAGFATSHRAVSLWKPGAEYNRSNATGAFSGFYVKPTLSGLTHVQSNTVVDAVIPAGLLE
eukprot:5739407-Prymnesium_polylepis.1